MKTKIDADKILTKYLKNIDNIENSKPKFQSGDNVIVLSNKLKLIVVDATLCLKGWRYELAFPKKDGTPDRRIGHRFHFEDDLKNNKL